MKHDKMLAHCQASVPSGGSLETPHSVAVLGSEFTPPPPTRRLRNKQSGIVLAGAIHTDHGSPAR